MPIHVITGLPGASKTAEMMTILLRESKKAQRPIFAAGIEGLAPGLAQELRDPTDWQSCPDGSLIFVDEAWKWFGHLHSAARQATPPHVLALAEHRHRGMDFVWTTQSPAQLYPFARSMIEQHWHIVRKWGTKLRDVYKWGELQDEVKSEGVRARAERSVSAIPTEVFGLYKSASEHTIKSRIPLKLWLLPIMALVVVLFVFAVYRYFTEDAAEQQAASGGLPTAAAAFDGAPVRVQPASEDLAAYLRPLAMRAPGLHGSQPIFDGRDARAEPRTFCVMSGGDNGDERCRCYTEQVTRLFDVRDDVCRHVARWGGYDPFLAPFEGREAETGEEPSDRQPRRAVGIRSEPGEVGSSSMGQVWGRHPETLRADWGS